MKRTWIGRHRPNTIGPIVKPRTHLISPQCDMSLEDRRMRAVVFMYIIEKVSHAHAQNAPLYLT